MHKTAKKNNIKELKSFTLMIMWAIPLLFIVIFPWLFDSNIQWWSFIVSFVAGLIYVFYPKAIYPFYRIWMAIALVIGWINTRLILAIVFYLMIFPIGIILGIFGKLHYQTRIEEDKNTFWSNPDEQITNENLERPF